MTEAAPASIAAPAHDGEALPRLSHRVLASGHRSAVTGVDLPPAHVLNLPERIVQFGTGALLRGLFDTMVDEANREGRFDGRIVMVGSTGAGRTDTLDAQDGLYTLGTQGTDEAGAPRERFQVVASVSRALDANTQWADVLALARQEGLALVVSNTTEVGIRLDEDDRPDLAPPRSFPGKLTAFLAERARAWRCAPEAGLIVLPCELVEDNGDLLRQIVHTLAERWGVEPDVQGWITQHVRFVNTLVDRIVPGTPPPEDRVAFEARLGYRDDLLTLAEEYRLLAVEGDEALAARLPIAGVPGVIVARSIAPYRERKLRLLNGTHTAVTPLMLLAGFAEVREVMADAAARAFVRRVMLDEIVPSLDGVEGAETFAHEVLARFANPFVRHELRAITLQQTMKWRVRLVPTILAYAAHTGRPPRALATGLAATLALVWRGDDVGPDEGAERL
ncbi:MAG TPA: tagaturonate reductase, partial [Rhodothermales bacterium]|nr:tagaturonate reductase [Rhodothermales bacterium]